MRELREPDDFTREAGFRPMGHNAVAAVLRNDLETKEIVLSQLWGDRIYMFCSLWANTLATEDEVRRFWLATHEVDLHRAMPPWAGPNGG
jgi:hypothetical protein